MSQNRITHRNHFVAESYLQRWNNSESKVASYRLLVPHDSMPVWSTKPPRSICYIEHLYTRIQDGGESDEFERYLSRNFEEPARDPMLRALADQRLSPEDWHHLVRFVACHDARTPKQMAQMVELLQRTMQDHLDNTLDEARLKLVSGDPLPEIPPLAEYTSLLPLRLSTIVPDDRRENVTIRAHALIGRSAALYGLTHKLEETIKVLYRQRWTILRAPQGVHWHTSDNPVVKVDIHPNGTYQFSQAWGTPGTLIFMPLSPTHIIYTVIGHRSPQRGEEVSAAYANELQRLIIANAYRYIFAAEVNPSIELQRPRTVDIEAYRNERTYWTNFHTEQTQAENEFNEAHSAHRTSVSTSPR